MRNRRTEYEEEIQSICRIEEVSRVRRIVETYLSLLVETLQEIQREWFGVDAEDDCEEVERF